jgi:hypothetical protein
VRRDLKNREPEIERLREIIGKWREWNEREPKGKENQEEMIRKNIVIYFKLKV